MLAYIPTFTALVAALLGLFGKTTLEEKVGLARITIIGWISFILAVTSFAGAIYSTHTTLATGKRLSVISALRIQGALENFIHPLQRTIVTYKGSGSWMYTGKDQFDMRLDRFRNKDFRDNLSKIKLSEIPPGNEVSLKTWQSEFENSIALAIAELDHQIILFGNHLPTEVILSLEKLRTELYIWRVKNLYELNRSVLKPAESATLKEVIDDYTLDSFLDSLQNVCTELRKTYDKDVIPPILAAEFTGKYSEIDLANQSKSGQQRQQ